MKKANNDKKVVEAQVAIVCKKDRDCCGYGEDCPGTYKVFPSGQVVFDHCGC
jgi:hypothetical protein